MLNITEQEQIILRTNAKNEVKRLEQILNDESTTQLLNYFKNKFNVCETAYKIILAEYLKCKGESSNEPLKLDMRQVPYALRFAGYDFVRNLLNELFGSKSKRGTTAKKLRDAVTHGISQKASDEIIARQDELFDYMDQFLNVIKTFDTIVV